MLALDRLRAARAGDDFEVVALSVDHGGVDAVKKFYADIRVQNLAIAVDPSAESSNALGVIGLPTTIRRSHRRGRGAFPRGACQVRTPDRLGRIDNYNEFGVIRL